MKLEEIEKLSRIFMHIVDRDTYECNLMREILPKLLAVAKASELVLKHFTMLKECGPSVVTTRDSLSSFPDGDHPLSFLSKSLAELEKE